MKMFFDALVFFFFLTLLGIGFYLIRMLHHG